MKKIVVVLLGLWVLSSVFIACSSVKPQRKQEDPNKLYSVEELRSDVDYIFNTITQVHSNPYRFIEKQTFENLRTILKKDIDQPLTKVDFYLKCSKVVAQIGDAGTNLAVPYDEYADTTMKGSKIIPFEIEIMYDKIFVKYYLKNDNAMPEGSEILSINKMKTPALLEIIRLTHCGDNENSRYDNFCKNFRVNIWNMFHKVGDLEVEFKSKADGKVYKKTIIGTTTEEITKAKSNIPAKPFYAYKFSHFPAKQYSVLDIKAFTNIDRFKEFLIDGLDSVKRAGIPNLIIDLRQNTGGDTSVINLLLEFISPTPVLLNSKYELRSSEQIRAQVRDTMPWFQRYAPNFLLKANFENNSLWSVPVGGLVSYTVPAPPKAFYSSHSVRFKGSLFVFIGPGTYANGAVLASVIKDYKLGLLFGEETGSLATYFGGNYNFETPVTGIEGSCSYKKVYRPSGEDDGKGVIPDVMMRTYLEDYISGRDRILEEAFKRFKR